MTKMQRLMPEKAGELFWTAPGEVLIKVSDFVTFFEMTPDELFSELRAGRLVACGTPVDDGYEDVTISAKSFLDWMGNVETPEHLAARVLKTMEATGRTRPASLV